MERTISRNPSLAEVRLHCLDMAVRSAQLLGRADGVSAVADGYFDWVMQGTPAAAAKADEPRVVSITVREPDTDQGPIADADPKPAADAKSGPASLRQADKAK